METLGSRIKNLRIKNNLTQEQLGNKLSIDRSSVSRWENNQLVPTEENIELLCKQFNVSRSYFFSDAENDPNLLTPVENNNEDKIKDMIIIVVLGIMSIFLSPFSLPVCIYLIWLSIRKKCHIIVVIFCIFVLFNAVYDLLFFMGIDILPTITWVS